MRRIPFAPSAVALATLIACAPVQAAPTSNEQLLKQMQQMAERLERLEKRNAELEQRLSGRVQALETQNAAVDSSLASNRLSDKEPEITTRLKYLEAQMEATKPASALAETLDGISVGGSVGVVAQRVNGNGRSDGKDESALGWRGDLEIGLPGGDIGRGSGEFFVHLRMGQGEGFGGTVPTFTGAYDSVSFQQGGVPSANTNAIIAQAWYQLSTPLGDENSGRSMQFTVGKMDPFGFFDQNEIADDESTRFLNNVFVHNPLLDSGGAVGADDYGFTPGVRMAYADESGAPESWQASFAVYGAGEGSTFSHSFTKPFMIGQLETSARPGGLDGNYRVYAWRNGQYEGFDGENDTNTGWGVSLDQKLNEDLTVFARYGHGTSGKSAFDRAVTIGGELTGNAWGRGADGLGFAYAWLRSASDFRKVAAELEDYAYAADGAEQVIELYYRWYLNEHLALTPDLQIVRHPGANEDGDTITTVGVRALYAF